jgi:hypothetical protein
MRKQYHLRAAATGSDAWDADQLMTGAADGAGLAFRS